MKPSDRAIAQAFWENWESKEDIPLDLIIDRANELDATAAPVVVGDLEPQVATRDTPCYLMTRDHVNDEKLPLIELSGPVVIAGRAVFTRKDEGTAALAGGE